MTIRFMDHVIGGNSLMANFILVLIAIESILLTLIVLHLFRKISMSSRILEIVIILAIVLAIVINTLIVFQ